MVIYELFWGERDQPFTDGYYDRTGLFCSVCHGVRRNLYPRPVDMNLKSIRARLSIGHVHRRGIGIIHQRLLDRLGEYMTGFAVGDVYDMGGKRLPKYRTFYSAHYINVRRPIESGICQCRDCRETCYDSEGDRYFLRHEWARGMCFTIRSATRTWMSGWRRRLTGASSRTSSCCRTPSWTGP